jgi:hypothetical protein
MVLKRENETLKQDWAAREELLNCLRFMPENIARLLFERLRTTSNPRTVLQSVRNEVLLRNPSEQATARGVLPMEFANAEFELSVKHPLSYPIVDPVEQELLSAVPSLSGGGSQGDSSLESESLISISPSPLTPGLSSTPSSAFGKQQESAFRVLVGPAMSGYYDPRFSQLNISFWTSVSISNHVAASAISLYLETDHPVSGLFDSELFIQSLIKQEFEFCSPFLVSSLLAWALVSSLLIFLPSLHSYSRLIRR